MDPAKSPNGANLIALKGGPGRGNVVGRLPAAGRNSGERDRGEPALPWWRRRVGVADRRRRGAGQPAMKVTVQFADGTSEEHVLKNGE